MEFDVDDDESAALNADQALTVGGVGSSILQPIVDKLQVMSVSRRTTLDDVVDVIASLLSSAEGLTSTFAAASWDDELECVSRRLSVAIKEVLARD